MFRDLDQLDVVKNTLDIKNYNDVLYPAKDLTEKKILEMRILQGVPKSQ